MSGPLPIRGVATRFGVWHEPTLASDPGNVNHTLVCFAPGCFDRSLERIRSGHAPFDLLVGHRDWRLASYADGCLLLTQAKGRLHLTVLPFGSAGRFACREVRDQAACGFRALSIEATITRAIRHNDGTRMIAMRATLSGVSLVQHGAMPGAVLLL